MGPLEKGIRLFSGLRNLVMGDRPDYPWAFVRWRDKKEAARLAVKRGGKHRAAEPGFAPAPRRRVRKGVLSGKPARWILSAPSVALEFSDGAIYVLTCNPEMRAAPGCWLANHTEVCAPSARETNHLASDENNLAPLDAQAQDQSRRRPNAPTCCFGRLQGLPMHTLRLDGIRKPDR